VFQRRNVSSAIFTTWVPKTFCHTTQKFNGFLTSRADTNCNGLKDAFKSGVLISRSERAVARDISSSEGCCLEGLLAAILLTAAMIAGNDR
jgi:hypothetical protein